ncbi:MAG: response regulator transcription factor [Clostridia bacterium]|nr:response regulator transcription factor [Clostridia bacterium]MBQ9505881.1 response regulator transcription factor [Clostridia bacterium]
MRIALCDDEPRETQKLEAMIGAYAFKRNYDMQCVRFTDGRELLKQEKFDLYFLDFRMDSMDGIAVAKALKEKFSHAVTICYLTNYEAAAVQIINHRIHADGFLKKPVSPDELEEKLDQFYGMSFFKRLELRNGKRFDTVYTQDILYVEADNKQVKLHMSNGVKEYRYTMGEIEAMLGDRFFRIQRSFLINFQHVASYGARTVTMKNGDVLSLKNKGFADAFHNYMFLLN